MDGPVLLDVPCGLKSGALQDPDGDTPLQHPVAISTEIRSGIRQVVPAGGKCLRRWCHQITVPFRRGAMVWSCLSHTGRKGWAGNTSSPPPETQGLDVSQTSIAKRLPPINTNSGNCFEWSRTHSIAHCNWNTLQKVPDLHKERKQHFGVQPAAQHNAMVKKQATERLFDVAC